MMKKEKMRHRERAKKSDLAVVCIGPLQWEIVVWLEAGVLSLFLTWPRVEERPADV